MLLSRHSTWKHGKVDSSQLRYCSREESLILNLAQKDAKNKGRKRKICIYCRSRLEVEVKCSKLEVSWYFCFSVHKIWLLSLECATLGGDLCFVAGVLRNTFYEAAVFWM